MVGVRFNGRLGNQIFQYAFFRYLKANNRWTFFYFINPQDASLTKYFEFPLVDELILGSKLLSVPPRAANKFLNIKEIYIESIQVPKPVKVQNWKIYKGFFQTDWYINNTPGGFDLRLKKEFTEKFDVEFGEIFNNHKTIVVHIRRTDYLNYGKRDISLPMEYFKKRLDALGNIDDYKVFFVSDDIEHVKSYFKEKPNYIFSSNNEITDFQIIKNADIAIISNSSFAWWACYLSSRKTTVYAPKNWLGFRIGKEHPKKVMTERFIWCDVLDN